MLHLHSKQFWQKKESKSVSHLGKGIWLERLNSESSSCGNSSLSWMERARHHPEGVQYVKIWPLPLMVQLRVPKHLAEVPWAWKDECGTEFRCFRYCCECHDTEQMMIAIVWFVQQILNWTGCANFHHKGSNCNAHPFCGIEGQSASQRTNGIHNSTIFCKKNYGYEHNE